MTNITRQRWRTGAYSSFMAIAICLGMPLAADPNLTLQRNDIRIEELGGEEGLLLTIKKHAGIQSILLTESTGGTAQAAAGTVYTYWSYVYDPINGNETRIINKRVLVDPLRYYLTDSTAEPDREFGEVFKIKIPPVIHYGFPWTRQNTIRLRDAEQVYINVRAFALPRADYCGAFFDNPFTITKITATPNANLDR